MKKFNQFIKRIICIVLVLAIMATTLAYNVFAVSPISEIEARLNQISASQNYAPGKHNPKNYCWNFVNAVSTALFGVFIPNRPDGYSLNGASNYWYLVDTVRDANATNANVANLLKLAQAGDVIQFRCQEASWQHTAMIYSTNANGITIYDSAPPGDVGYQVVRKYTCSWNQIASGFWSYPAGLGTFEDKGTRRGHTGYGLSLYRCSKDISTATINSNNLPNPGSGNISGTANTGVADTITQTSAILRGSVSSTGAKMTQCGMLLGTTVENMTLLGKDSINTYGTTCFYSTSKYGRTLTPGTTYYYQVYAVVDGKEYKGNVRSFRTTGTSTPTEPTLTATATTGTATNITHDSALFSGSFSASSAVTLKQFGVLLGKTQSTMLKYPDTTKANLTTTSCSFQLSAANLGIKLEPNTTYYYCTYAFFGDAARMGEIRSFKTAAAPQNPVSHVSISLSQSSMTIQDNVCKNLSVTTTPANLAVTWKSSNPSVATVNKGAVTGLKAGNTTITASVSYNGQTASASCVVTVQASKEPCSHVKGKYLWYNSAHPHYDYYQCAICGETYRGTTTNIMPTCEICCPVNAYGIRLSSLSATNITANSVRLNASCTYTGSRPTSVGVYLGTTPTNIQIKGSDGNISHNKNPFDIWYNLNGLTTGTTYYYRFYAVVDGKTSYSEIKSFTTK